MIIDLKFTTYRVLWFLSELSEGISLYFKSNMEIHPGSCLIDLILEINVMADELISELLFSRSNMNWFCSRWFLKTTFWKKDQWNQFYNFHTDIFWGVFSRFNFSCSFSFTVIWDALLDLVPFLIFTKREKPCMGVSSRFALLHECFSSFLNCTNYTKSREESHFQKV